MEEGKYQYYRDLIKGLAGTRTPSYEELLYTYEWVGTREAVNTRDNWTCQDCGTSMHIKMSDEELQSENNLQDADVILNPHISLFSPEDISKMELVDSSIAEIMRNARIDNKPVRLTGYKVNPIIPQLEVHHEAYLLGKAPWEYPESWLTTLCKDCHHNRHFEEDGSPKKPMKTYRNVTKKEVITGANCDRCGGGGYILEYSFNKGGVCFKCHGTGINPHA